MDEEEARTTLHDLMSPATESEPRRARPPSAVLVIASVAGIVLSVTLIARLTYWLFPLPWDILAWLAKVSLWYAGHA